MLPPLCIVLKEVKRRIDNLVAAIKQGILMPSMKARIEELEQQREALETSILPELIENPSITREQILCSFDQFRHGDPEDIVFQEKVIDCFVNSIYLFDDRIVVNFNYQEGGRPIPLEEVHGSFLDGNGVPPQNHPDLFPRGDRFGCFFVPIFALRSCPICKPFGRQSMRRTGPYNLPYTNEWNTVPSVSNRASPSCLRATASMEARPTPKSSRLLERNLPFSR